ncbi:MULTISPECIES: NAD(P)-dependent alcohol dehydrogenase [unclassified Curtobacterium]|uniref:zinc-dependent alcohol dehydrogenase family protein n=1 Tax=unclassified Curtobacterium TaxID=257496 RepID=UPI0021AC24E7|nr:MULTISPECIES: NAD(P)-dependent alcohol dehydrogenase [unclassified Curtobacterium]
MLIRTRDGETRLEAAELADPGLPAADELRVRITASTVNYNESLVVRGAIGVPDRFITLADAAGVVEAVGPDVVGFAEGDRVISRFFPTWDDDWRAPVPHFGTTPGLGTDGYAQEVVVVPSNHFSAAPSTWSDAEAAVLPVAGMTAWRALVVEGGLKAGDSVLVMGTGGVSLFGLQLAKAVGATVIVTSSSDDKLARARALGADVTINYRSTPEWGDAVLEATGGLGADHVIEVGGADTLSQSIKAVRVGGQITMIGMLTGLTGAVPTGDITMKQVRLHGAVVGNGRQQRELVRAIDARDAFRPVIDKTYRLDHLAEAFEDLSSGRHFGKISIEI